MSELPPNAFIGRTAPPADADLAGALGPAKATWDKMLAALASGQGVSVQEWKSYSAKAGWALRLLRGKRTIVWVSPCSGCIRVAFILGDKAVAAARQSKLPARIIKMLDEAPRYPEGTGLRLHIKTEKEVSVVLQLAEIKMRN
jgi:hypothetical protein